MHRLFALLLTPVPALAQTVWTVDDTPAAGADFLLVQPAIDAAASGDLILVAQGVYVEELVIDGKALAIHAEAGADVRFLWSTAHPVDVPIVTVRNLAAGQTVALRGLRLDSSDSAGLTLVADASLVVEDCAGTVWVEDCVLGMPGGLPGSIGLRTRNAAGVVLSRCDVLAEHSSGFFTQGARLGTALTAVDSGLALFDCLVEGGLGFDGGSFQPRPGGHGAEIQGGLCFASGTTFAGGQGGTAFFPFPGEDGGDGLVATVGALVRERDSAFAAGAAGEPGPNEPGGSPGAPTTVAGATLLSIPGGARALHEASPLVAGVDDAVETLTGLPGDQVWRLYSSVPLAPLHVAVARGSLVLAPELFGDFLGTLDGSGTLTVATPLPPLPVGLATTSLFTQAVFLGAGAGFFLSAPSLLTVLAP